MAYPLEPGTRSLEWYNACLEKQQRKPLLEFEKSSIELSVRMQYRQTQESSACKVNRTFKEFFDLNPTGLKTLVLGSGEKHADIPSEKSHTYTVDIEAVVKPDLLGSINDAKAMNKIPDESFDEVIWEYIPVFYLLNTESFNQVHRILKQSGVAKLIMPLAGCRVLPILIQETPFKDQISADYCREVPMCVKNNRLDFDDEAFERLGPVLLHK